MWWNESELAKMSTRTEIVEGLDMKPLVITDANSAVGIQDSKFVVGAKFRVRETALRADARNRRVSLHARAPDGKWFVRFEHRDFKDARFPNAAGAQHRRRRARRHPDGLAFSELELMTEEYKLTQQRAEAKHERRRLGKRARRAGSTCARSAYPPTWCGGGRRRRGVVQDDAAAAAALHRRGTSGRPKARSSPSRRSAFLDAP